MAFVLIDTSAWLFGVPPWVVPAIRERITALVEENLVATAPPIVFELLQGARTTAECDQWSRHLASLHQVPFPNEEWVPAAEWVRQVWSRGARVKSMDLLIAYMAVRHQLILLHADRDFDRIADVVPLRVESYVRFARH